MTSEPDDASTLSPGLTRRALLALASVGLGSLAVANVFGDSHTARASPVWVGGWDSPLNTASPGINSPFLEGGPGRGYYDGSNYHLGLDLAAASGDPVYSIGPGTVIAESNGNPGRVLYIKHAAHDGTEFLAVYAHINATASGHVAAGQQVGTVFTQAAHHLHFGIRTVTGIPTRFGARDLDYWPTTDGFAEPGDFLAAHPRSTTVIDEGEEEIYYMASSSSADGMIQYGYLYVNSADGPLRALSSIEGGAILQLRASSTVTWSGHDIRQLVKIVGLRAPGPAQGLIQADGNPIANDGRLTASIVY